jgi:uncharacterized protein (TIGR02271 family)
LATTPAVCCESHANKEVSVTQYEGRSDRFTALEDRFAGYEVYDQAGEKIGKVDDLFVDESDSPEYIGVKMGFLGMSSTLIPWEAVSSTDDEGKAITVATDKATTKNGPTFDDDRDITPEFENEVYSYYGLQRTSSTEESGAYESYYAEETTQTAGMADRTDLADEDELRVQRTEEELAAGTREREAGQLKVRKRVRTDREHIEVPTRHEEVSVERVPVEGEATEAEIGEDEVVVPVTEEEVVVGKRPVVKEEVRIRKDVVEDTETVEEDVRREEIEVEDETATRRGL